MEKIILFLLCLLISSSVAADEYDFEKMFAGEKEKNTVTQHKGTVEVDDFMNKSQKERVKVSSDYERKFNQVDTGPIMFVTVSADVMHPLCHVEKLTLSGGTNSFSGNGVTSSVGILKDFNGTFSGTVHYSAKTSCNKYCTGSFTVSGKKGNVYIQLTDSCDATINEH